MFIESGTQNESQEFRAPKSFKREVPFPNVVKSALDAAKTTGKYAELYAELFISHQQYLAPFLSFQDQRLMENPAIAVPETKPLTPQILLPTAFEAYLLGTRDNNTGLPITVPEQIIATIAELGNNELDYLARNHRHQHGGFTSQLIRVLTENRVMRVADMQVLAEADTTLGAIIARLKARMVTSEFAKKYRSQTHDAIERIAGCYEVTMDPSGHIIQSFQLPQVRREIIMTPLSTTLNDLTPKQQQGWEFMQLVGKLGNPLVRIVRPYIYEFNSSTPLAITT